MNNEKEIEEQTRVLENDKKRMLVSASAGSGKTFVMIKYITNLVCRKKVPVENLLVLTFTKAAATEMKTRLQKSLKAEEKNEFIIQQLDSLSTANISTIHAFCEKAIKKYANLLNLDENFSIADESVSQKLRQDAFEIALKKLQSEESDVYEFIMSSYKNNHNKVQSIVLEIENLVNSVSDKEDFLKRNKENSVDYFEKAMQYLFANTKKQLEEGVQEIRSLHLDEFADEVSEALLPAMKEKEFLGFALSLENFKFPSLPKKKDIGDDEAEVLKLIRKNIMDIISSIVTLNLSSQENLQAQKDGILEKRLIELFQRYETIETNLKKSQNLLDFYDLEKYMQILSCKENLFSNIEYVFVDEYQDTNKIQERIIKNVAKNSNFVAVGDVKQGIYGFRLASSEIFLKDQKDFQQDADSAVNFLKSNFRSSPKVLDFVNNVFEVCMTEEVCGVEYKNSSMLQSKAQYLPEQAKSVNIDVVAQPKPETIDLVNIYSVKDAKIVANDKNLLMLQDIKSRISEVLATEIYIEKEKVFRKCRYSDIAILSRKRDDLFNELEDYLLKNDVSVVSKSRNLLLEEAEVQVLLNFLKLALNMDDDVACLSVLLSGLGGFKPETIVEEKFERNETLCEIVLNDENKTFEKFNANLREFRQNLLVLGVKKAFMNLFIKTNYRAFINTKTDQRKINLFIDKFLSEIEKSGFEFDVAGLVNYFESVDITVTADANAVEDAVLLTTIHNSKGLEYPIVFLINCDQSLSRTRPKVDIQINEKFGLGVKFYDIENNNEIKTVKMKAIQEEEKQKDFAEELMIFYVALTRAKNRLYLFGEFDESHFDRHSLKVCDSYFDLIFFALKNVKENFLECQKYEDENLSVSFVESVSEINKTFQEKNTETKNDENLINDLKSYLNFEYRFNENSNFKLKETVTSLNNRFKEDKLHTYSNDNFSFGGETVEVGNAYHLALKLLEFEKISDLQTLKNEAEKLKDLVDLSLIDLDILLKNILKLKEITEKGNIFKEKEFILKEKVSNLLQSELEEKILVQGVIDLFIIKNNKIILIDYKYSNNNAEKLIKNYENQIKYYKIALENAFNLPVEECYLLSLKNANLIKL